MTAGIARLTNANSTAGGVRRVVVRRNLALAYAMPEAHREKIAQIPGVTSVCPVNWFGGVYKEEKPKYFFAQFYVDTSNIFDVMSEYSVPPDQLAAFKQDRTGAVCGAKLAQKQGWNLGDI